MRKTDSKKLETRDFISVGIFSLIYAVVAFVIGGAAQMTPVTFPFMPMIVALFTGTVFMLYVAKIPKKGALSILGVIAAILLFVTGMFWMMSVFFLVFGVIADFICASADFRSFKKNLLAYHCGGDDHPWRSGADVRYHYGKCGGRVYPRHRDWRLAYDL